MCNLTKKLPFGHGARANNRLRHRSCRPARRGVLLLVVLSLLVLFVLAGISFIVVAGQFRKGSVPVMRMERTGTAPRKLMDTVVNQILNPPDHGSALSGHGLLEDIYGREGFVGAILTVAPPPAMVAREFLTITVQVTTPPPIQSFYAGSVVTITSGPLMGLSARVASFDWDPASPTIIELRTETFGGQRPNVGASLVVNGRPFNGTGHGYLPTPVPPILPNLDLAFDYGGALGPLPIALLPRKATTSVGSTPAFIGGADESYDAPDFQNMLLGWMDTQVGLTIGGQAIIPSMHRPDLINFWDAYMRNTLGVTAGLVDASNAQTRQLLYDVCLRPTVLDHPLFTGGNPWLDLSGQSFQGHSTADARLREYLTRLIHGVADLDGDGDPDVTTWDVDNDGDGITDSVWVDLGLPVESAADGRRYKPLVAILCLDLDGRINLNTAGIVDVFAIDGPTTAAYMAAAAGLTFNPAVAPEGQGVGPAEIDLSRVFASFAEFDAVRQDRYRAAYDAANLLLPGNPAAPDLALWPFWHQVDPPGALPPHRSGLHGSPLDLMTRGTVILDHLGQPISTQYLGAETNIHEWMNHPYELNVVSPNGWDAIYTPKELEGLLRPFDIDFQARSMRLAALASFTTEPDALRRTRLATTLSFDVPMANVQVPAELRDVVGPQGSLADIYAYWLRDFSGLAPADVLIQLQIQLPYEFRFGQRMNLNRRFGDGFDDPSNPNNVVDEPFDEDLMSLTSLINDDPLFTPNVVAVPSPVHQLYARHLYCLMMYLCNKNVNLAPAGWGAANGYASERVLAQWAINVVDFLDPDSIMTPFEVDLDPFDGWDVTGTDLSVDPSRPWRAVVWGVERPELLITETLAWHDRRSQDRDDESIDAVGNPVANPQKMAGGDPDRDQFALPLGSLFVELYNPWTIDYASPAAELHDAAGRLQLDRVAVSADGSITSPVWRLVITPEFSLDPDHDTTFILTEARFVYFVNEAVYSDPGFTPKAVGTTTKDFFNSISPTGTFVEPGQYAVVGSAGPGIPVAGGPIRWISTVGFKRNETFDSTSMLPTILYDETRHVELSPGSVDYQVKVVNNGYISNGFANPDYVGVGTDIRQNVAIAINRSRLGMDLVPASESLNVSTPIDGYDLTRGAVTIEVQRYGDRTGGQNGDPENELVLSEVLDKPLDMGDDGTTDRFGIHVNATDPFHGVLQNYRTVYLQRLANPLVPYNQLTNPYRTVDKATVDLTVFDGFESNPTPIPFYAKQRGDYFKALASPHQSRNIWRREADTSTFSYPDSTPDPFLSLPPHYFGYVCQTSLGYTNDAYRPYFDGTTAPSDGYVGAPDSRTTVPETYPWLVWNNRPFANALELMNVPRTSSSMLLENFAIQPTASSDTVDNQPHGNEYLLPFLADRPSGPPPAVHDSTMDPGLNRLFDYVEVPSRFAGTKKWFDPAIIGADPNTPSGLKEPNNRLSQFRDPGRINLNTISDPEVFKALGASFGMTEAELDMLWDAIDFDRRGSTGFNQNNLNLDPNTPSQFVKPYRSAAAADLAPLAQLRTNGREGSLLRFQRILDTIYPLHGIQTSHRDHARNPQFHYEALRKLSAMTTNHSNVYAVWVTIGYFQVEPYYGLNADGTAFVPPIGAPPIVDARHPDGLMLTTELGSDIGDTVRNRAFYIIDRSIPVAYEPGQLHNARDTIVLQRFIE